jgi:hypothetical protein
MTGKIQTMYYISEKYRVLLISVVEIMSDGDLSSQKGCTFILSKVEDG